MIFKENLSSLLTAHQFCGTEVVMVISSGQEINNQSSDQRAHIQECRLLKCTYEVKVSLLHTTQFEVLHDQFSGLGLKQDFFFFNMQQIRTRNF